MNWPTHKAKARQRRSAKIYAKKKARKGIQVSVKRSDENGESSEL